MKQVPGNNDNKPLWHFMQEAEQHVAEPPQIKLESQSHKKKRSKYPGDAVDAELDDERLTGLQLAVFNLMKDGVWRTHGEIKLYIGRGSENGIAALLRNLRSKRRGSHTVNKQRRGHPKSGLWEYQLIVNPRSKQPSKGEEKSDERG